MNINHSQKKQGVQLNQVVRSTCRLFTGDYHNGPFALTAHTAYHPNHIAKECNSLQNKATSVSQAGPYILFDYQVHNFKKY